MGARGGGTDGRGPLRHMNILHITSHLGGGVGKAHAALAEATPGARGRAGKIARTYALLEAPKDVSYLERIAAAGGHMVICPNADRLSTLVEAADIVQVEWWNHPRLYGLLATTPLPAMRLALWVHISGLAPPLVPARLVDLADKTLFTSPCSLEAPNLAPLVRARPEAFGVANSGFGFAPPQRPACPVQPLRFGYMGTLDFIKLHPGFFDAIDAVEDDVRVSLWGQHDPLSEVAARAAAMRHPERIRFEGYASDPRAVLSELDVFVYLLTPGHYGTAENVLVEAMSVGATPIVWDNRAETSIVRDGRNGFVVRSIEQCAGLIDWSRRNPRRVARMGSKAIYDMEHSRTAAATLRGFARTYDELLTAPRQRRDFAAALGADSRSWFLSTLRTEDSDPTPASRLLSGMAAKGSLGHFRTCFPEDAGLAALALA